jgi:Cysteine-rich CPXCG
MEPTNRRRHPRARSLTTPSSEIDSLYGLEPVFEPGAAAALSDFVGVHCPYCGESYGISVDLTAGSQTQIEDCQVCCQPIEFAIKVGRSGTLRSVTTRRLD